MQKWRYVGRDCFENDIGIKLKIAVRYMISHAYYGTPWNLRKFSI